MLDHHVATREDWLAARKALLEEEKEFTRARDALSVKRRALPWVKIDKPYGFEGPGGALSLGDLFGPERQLIVYHFMFAPDWEKPCKSCSFCADGFNGAVAHLARRWRNSRRASARWGGASPGSPRETATSTTIFLSRSATRISPPARRPTITPPGRGRSKTCRGSAPSSRTTAGPS